MGERGKTGAARKGLAAAVYTQTTDFESEINGLVTYHRKALKFDAGTLSRIHRDAPEFAGRGQDIQARNPPFGLRQKGCNSPRKPGAA